MSRLISVFVGPSLPPAKRPGAAGLRYLLPARAGDMLALADEAPPHAVLLIDGLFEHERAPWHKEILVLLSLGFEVWGAASLGAIRAAELAAFGMRASGGIARAYRDGRIIGDDEVAVAHAPAALGHQALTLAQVDVRATLMAAVRGGVLTPDDARVVRSLSRGIFFKERTWETVTDAARGQIAARGHASLAEWLPAGAVPQKQLDAIGAIAGICASPRTTTPREPPPETVFLERLRAEVSALQRENSSRTSASRLDRETAGEV